MGETPGTLDDCTKSEWVGEQTETVEEWNRGHVTIFTGVPRKRSPNVRGDNTSPLVQWTGSKSSVGLWVDQQQFPVRGWRRFSQQNFFLTHTSLSGVVGWLSEVDREIKGGVKESVFPNRTGERERQTVSREGTFYNRVRTIQNFSFVSLNLLGNVIVGMNSCFFGIISLYWL